MQERAPLLSAINSPRDLCRMGGAAFVRLAGEIRELIGPNVGGLSRYLSRLSMKARYQKFRRAFDSAMFVPHALSEIHALNG